jgi:hypothetical protein
MDPKELTRNEALVSTSSPTEKVVTIETVEPSTISYDISGCWNDEWDNHQGDIILFN